MIFLVSVVRFFCNIKFHFSSVPPPPVISFTQPVYNASESGNAIIGIFVEEEKITKPVTVRCVDLCLNYYAIQ